MGGVRPRPVARRLAACATASTRTTSSPASAPRRTRTTPDATVVEFVVAAGQEGTGAWLRATVDGDTRSSVPTSSRPSPADIVFTVTPADATALHDGTLDLSRRVHARPGEDGRRLRRAAAVPAAHRRRRTRPCRSPSSCPASAGSRHRQGEMPALEDARHGGAALAVEAQVADPGDLAGRRDRAPRGRRRWRRAPRSRRRRAARSGRSPSARSTRRGCTSDSRNRSWRRRRPAPRRRCPRRRRRSARRPSAGTRAPRSRPRPYPVSRSTTTPGGGVAPEGRRDRHVDADEIALEAERLEQHAGARVAEVDTRPQVARHGAREVRARARRSPRRRRAPRGRAPRRGPRLALRARRRRARATPSGGSPCSLNV